MLTTRCDVFTKASKSVRGCDVKLLNVVSMLKEFSRSEGVTYAANVVSFLRVNCSGPSPNQRLALSWRRTTVSGHSGNVVEMDHCKLRTGPASIRLGLQPGSTVCNRTIQYISLCLCLFLWPPYGIGQAIIFLPCSFFFLSSSIFFCPRLISAVRDRMSIILPHMVWP